MEFVLRMHNLPICCAGCRCIPQQAFKITQQSPVAVARSQICPLAPLCFHLPVQSRSAPAQHAMERLVLGHQAGEAIRDVYQGVGKMTASGRKQPLQDLPCMASPQISACSQHRL